MIDDNRITVGVHGSLGAGSDWMVCLGQSWLSAVPPHATTQAPVIASPGQAYYWTRAWQMEERENLRELDAGLGRVFHDRDELMRYLLSADDD